MKRISIIIPVHNVEKYLEKCLNSIISQINEQDEIILINDNSQDSSEQICKKFVEQYKTRKWNLWWTIENKKHWDKHSNRKIYNVCRFG